jgi:hypothetical protein
MEHVLVSKTQYLDLLETVDEAILQLNNVRQYLLELDEDWFPLDDCDCVDCDCFDYVDEDEEHSDDYWFPQDKE